MHVKVDNWGIYFLQRLKHFFNRTDYCDLTLQFQDNAQLKVHRLVLSACTEYFELLERTREIYEGCLVMPDDLQAEFVVPIINFMYTGKLEFHSDSLEKLYQTSLVMNVAVLSKLLDTYRQNLQARPAPIHSYSNNPNPDVLVYKTKKKSMAFKCSFNEAFEHDSENKSKKMDSMFCVSPESSMRNSHQSSSDLYNFPVISESNKHLVQEPRPTRYELPEELDVDNIIDNSFTGVSYTSKPLLVHPDTVKHYGSKESNLYKDASSSKWFPKGSSNDIVECRKITMNTNLFDNGPDIVDDKDEIFRQPAFNKKEIQDASQLFDQIILFESEGPKLTIKRGDSKQVNNIDNVKIISEFLKKYPHLMKSNKNIKVKIDTPNKCKKKSNVIINKSMAFKFSFNEAFEHDSENKSKKMDSMFCVSPESSMRNSHQSSSDLYNFPVISESNKHLVQEPRPTRYELPEELDVDNIIDNSFTGVSYTSKPLLVHPDTVKHYGSKESNLYKDASSSKWFSKGSSNDIVECRKITMNTNLFDNGPDIVDDKDEIFRQPASNKKEIQDASQLFDQIILFESEGPKLIIKRGDSKQVNNIDNVKIISEFLKKYPHLMKSNKNIKVKILDTPNKCKKKSHVIKDEKEIKSKPEPPDFTYESDVIDSKEAARLIALGAENIYGPWICLICGTPGRALHFSSYDKFRRHLVDVHNEKRVSTICEYCGLKSLKRNNLLHHLYTKHGVEPPSNYNFPKCNHCNYIVLTKGFLVKHKMTHTEHKGFRCNVCASSFGTSNQLLVHIQKTGHKYSADKKRTYNVSTA